MDILGQRDTRPLACCRIRIAGWFADHQRMLKSAGTPRTDGRQLSRQRLILAFAVIGALLLSKFVYIETFKS